jgi:Tfp pilus assembly PilM family ATPase
VVPMSAREPVTMAELISVCFGTAGLAPTQMKISEFAALRSWLLQAMREAVDGQTQLSGE